MRKLLTAIAASTLVALCSCSSIIAGRIPEVKVPHTASFPVIDGKIADAEWAKAATIKGLKPCLNGKYQKSIDKVPTEIKLLWTEDFLFVAFVCYDNDIVATMTNHDDLLYKEDVCEVFIDGVGDGRQYSELQVSPNNIVLDQMFVLSGAPAYTKTLRLKPGFADKWAFLEWNMKNLQTATAPLMKDGKKVGWSTELAIPAQSIVKRHGTNNLFPTTIRANFMRYDWQPDAKGKRHMIHMNWSPVQHGCPHISAAAMGKLILEKPVISNQ